MYRLTPSLSVIVLVAGTVELVDRCMEKLLAVKSMRPGTEVTLCVDDITSVVLRARELFLAQPMLLEVSAYPHTLTRKLFVWANVGSESYLVCCTVHSRDC